MSDKHSHDRHKWHRVRSLVTLLRRIRPTQGWRIETKLLMLTLPLIVAVTAVAVWALQMRTVVNLHQRLTERARSLHTQIMADRQYYALVIVPRVVELGGTLGTDYRQVHGRFPLPATFVREVSERTAKVQEGYTASLISPWAINPDKGAKDQFQRDAFAYLMEHPTGQFIRTDTLEGHAVLRILMGDRASAQSCVDCHNAHPQSSKHDFKLGGLMGGLEIAIPIESYLNESRQDSVLTVAGGVGLCLLVIGAVVLGTRQTVTRPLERLGEKMRAFSEKEKGPLTQADAVPFGDEVVRLEKTFENMLEDIQKEKIKFHRVVESAPNAILLVNQQGTITLVNAQAERLFGYAREDLLGQPIEALVPSRFRGAHPGHRAAFFADPKTRAMGAGRDLYGLHKDGREIPIEIGLNPIETEESPLVLASIVDITERKQAEEERDRFFTLSLDMMCIAKSDGYFKRVSPAFTQTLGWSTEEMLARPFLDFVHPDDRPATLREVEKLVVSGENVFQFENRYRHKDGSWRTLSWKSVPQPGGIMYATARDITEQKKAEGIVKESAQRLDLALDSAQMGAWDLNLTNDTAVRSLKHDQIFGYSSLQPEWGSEIFLTHVVPEDRDLVKKRFEEAFATGHFNMECRITWPDQSLHWITVQGRVSRNQKGDPVRMMGLVTDITARKRAEAILRETQQAADRANQAKSEFLSRMSHELRTPLNAILGFAQLLEMDPLTPDQRESIARILHGGRHLLNLINEVLDISRIEAGHLRLSLEPVPLQETVREALDMIRPLADLRHITVRSDVGQAEGLHVKADRQRLRQVVLNLLSNAVKYNRESGSVTVTSTLTADGYAQVAVTDTGPGISSEKLARLFMPFDRLGAEQTGIEGTGLGLSLSKHLVEAMGGRLGVDSVVGQGSTFWVEMTVVPPPTGETALSHPAAPARSSTRHLLLYIEDNLSNLELIQKLLAARPEIKLLSAMQGRLGLDLARHHKPDLILLDLHLPDLGGEAVLLQLKAEPALRAIPVIILSADASQGQIERLRASGAHAYLTKPLNLKQLLALLSETLA